MGLGNSFSMLGGVDGNERSVADTKGGKDEDEDTIEEGDAAL